MVYDNLDLGLKSMTCVTNGGFIISQFDRYLPFQVLNTLYLFKNIYLFWLTLLLMMISHGHNSNTNLSQVYAFSSPPSHTPLTPNSQLYWVISSVTLPLDLCCYLAGYL